MILRHFSHRDSSYEYFGCLFFGFQMSVPVPCLWCSTRHSPWCWCDSGVPDHQSGHVRVSCNGGTPSYGWFIAFYFMENPIQMNINGWWYGVPLWRNGNHTMFWNQQKGQHRWGEHFHIFSPLKWAKGADPLAVSLSSRSWAALPGGSIGGHCFHSCRSWDSSRHQSRFLHLRSKQMVWSF